MNILPKKSWHVRNKDNIERVRRDEEKAAQEEKEKQRRIALAEQEARTDLLRSRAKKRQLEYDDGEGTSSATHGKEVSIINDNNRHINFFKEEEKGIDTAKGNKDYEAEKKAEKEKHEKSIGLLTYLGQSAIEAQNDKPWYHASPEKRRKAEPSKEQPKDERDEFEKKKKFSLDPMKDMMSYLDKKKKHKDHKKGKDRYKEKDKSRKKEKKKHKHDRADKDEKPESSKPSGGKTIQQLRAERLKREQQERAKTEELMKKMRGELPEREKSPETDERKLSYNSQFNPELARKPKKRAYESYDYT